MRRPRVDSSVRSVERGGGARRSGRSVGGRHRRPAAPVARTGRVVVGTVGVLGAIPTRGTLRLADLMQHPSFRGFPANHPPMGSFLGTAVRVRDRVYGYLYLS